MSNPSTFVAAAAAFQQKVNPPIDVARDQTYGSFNYAAIRHTTFRLPFALHLKENYWNFAFRFLKQDGQASSAKTRYLNETSYRQKPDI